jgi:hypothetical protein
MSLPAHLNQPQQLSHPPELSHSLLLLSGLATPAVHGLTTSAAQLVLESATDYMNNVWRDAEWLSDRLVRDRSACLLRADNRGLAPDAKALRRRHRGRRVPWLDVHRMGCRSGDGVQSPATAAILCAARLAPTAAFATADRSRLAIGLILSALLLGR